MMTPTDIRALKPYPQTLEKAIGFISCASKQGRVSIVMYASPDIVDQLKKIGYNIIRDASCRAIDVRRIEVNWDD